MSEITYEEKRTTKLEEEKEVRPKHKGNPGNPGWKSDIWGWIVLSVTLTVIVVVVTLLIVYLKKRKISRLPPDLCVGLLEDFIELVEWPEHLAINFFHQIDRVEATASVQPHWPALVGGLDLLKGNGVINELQYQCGLAQGRIIYGQ